MMNLERSRSLFAEAQELLPGGVDSPVRAFAGVGGIPRFIARGEGSHIVDVDGNRYIDYVLSWGPLAVGHAHPLVVSAVIDAVTCGTSFGAPTEYESQLARLIRDSVPSMERIRFVSSGTEAVMSAVRVARASTQRDLVVKFQGCYHGHADSMLADAGSGVATLGIPGSPGVPAAVAQATATLPYNDLAAAQSYFRANGTRVAAVIVEPAAGNMGVVPPAPGFLETLRELTRGSGALLIFDEVITGFRVDLGGAQRRFGVTPDLTTMGKIIGGGFPVGAYGGRKDLMELVAPSGPVYQAGTLSGNPVAMRAGIATIRTLCEGAGWSVAAERTAALADGLRRAARAARVDVCVNQIGTMLSLFFTRGPVVDWTSARASDTGRFARYFHALIEAGISVAPSAFESSFLSTVHSDNDIDATIDAAHRAMAAL